MEKHPEHTPETATRFPDVIGQDYELWKKYYEECGIQAYRYRRLYEEAASQLTALYRYAEENGIDLPDPGPSFT